MKLRTTAGSLLLLILFPACGKRETSAPPTGPATAPANPAPTAATPAAISWEDEVAAWKQNRHDRLSRDDGWLTLVGFAWLEEGDNAVGSDRSNPVRLPEGKAPARLGTIRLEKGKAKFTSEPGAAVTSGGAPVTAIDLVSDAEGDPTKLEHGSLSFFVIERADRLAVRIRDREAETLKHFAGMDYYPLDRAWRIEGRFEPAKEVREVPIPNVLGFEEKIRNPGHVVIEVDGAERRLLALDDTGDGRLFLVFGDGTNGQETYGGGRFLYADPPQDGRVVVDFNRAYNPPCVFTPYATCPLPPPGNRFPFPIRAGEKKYVHEAAHAATETAGQPGA